MEENVSVNARVPTLSGPSNSPAGSTVLRGPVFGKDGFFSWRIMGAVFATLLVVGWVFIVIILIQEEKWQLVLVAWLLLYAAAHFCYWYFKRHHLFSLHSHICRRVRASQSVPSVSPLNKPLDAPPSYDDVIKSENPPPTYCSLVLDTSKCSPKSMNKKFLLFSLDSLPNVFSGRVSSNNNHPPACPSTSRKTPGTTTTTTSHPPSYSPSISASISDVSPYRWRLQQQQTSPPTYDQSCVVDIESQAEGTAVHPISSTSRNIRSSRSVLRSDSHSSNGPINPILAPIHDNLGIRVDSPLPHTFCNDSDHLAGTSTVQADPEERKLRNLKDSDDHQETRRNSQ